MFVHTDTSENKYTGLESYNFFPLLVQAGRHLIFKGQAAGRYNANNSSRMLSEIADVRKIFL